MKKVRWAGCKVAGTVIVEPFYIYYHQFRLRDLVASVRVYLFQPGS